MAVTNEDVLDFNRFVAEKLVTGGAESLVDMATEWQQRRDDEKSLAALRQSHADAEAGRLHSADEVFAEVRGKLGEVE